MIDIYSYLTPGVIIALVVLMIWEFYWKGRGMWQAARNGHLKWFVAMLLLNTAGILPIVYIRYFSSKK